MFFGVRLSCKLEHLAEPPTSQEKNRRSRQNHLMTSKNHQLKKKKDFMTSFGTYCSKRIQLTQTVLSHIEQQYKIFRSTNTSFCLFVELLISEAHKDSATDPSLNSYSEFDGSKGQPDHHSPTIGHCVLTTVSRCTCPPPPPPPPLPPPERFEHPVLVGRYVPH